VVLSQLPPPRPPSGCTDDEHSLMHPSARKRVFATNRPYRRVWPCLAGQGMVGPDACGPQLSARRAASYPTGLRPDVYATGGALVHAAEAADFLSPRRRALFAPPQQSTQTAPLRTRGAGAANPVGGFSSGWVLGAISSRTPRIDVWRNLQFQAQCPNSSERVPN
jgi:hypothetical protein